MEFIMSIGDVTTITNIGNVIVGENPEITKTDTSKLCKKGENIIIRSAEQEFIFKVQDISLSCSISEKVIVSLQLEESENFSKIKPGDLIFKD